MNEQIIAFAAICQITSDVQSLARNGQIDSETYEINLRSVVNMSPENTLSIYGGDIKHIEKGLKVLVKQLGDENPHKDPELTKYIVNLIALAGKLTKQPKILEKLSKALSDVERQLDHFDITSENIVANLASIYGELISPLGAKIQVAGDSSVLKQPVNQQKIRALLLAGIRAVVLWRQLGGKRRHIIFKRRAMLSKAQALLNRI